MSSCKKFAFYGDNCSGDCYILTGNVVDDSTGNPIKSAEVVLKAPKGIFIKEVVRTSTDENGDWRMSFDANYIEDIASGTLEFSRSDYLRRSHKIGFSSSDINVEKDVSETLHQAGFVYFDMTINDPCIERVQARFTFEGEEFSIYKPINGEKPLNEGLPHKVPGFKDIVIGLFSSESANIGNNEWNFIPSSSQVVNVAYQNTDTLVVEF